jgi:acyl-CoA thioester hydrolase
MFRSVPTRWHDNDLYGHMNNGIHYQLFDTVVNGWLMEVGLLKFQAEHAFIVAETGCRSHGDIMYPDVVHAGMRISKLGSSSIAWQIGLFRNDSEVAAADGLFVHVHVKREGHRPTPMGDDVRAVLEPLVR